MQKLLDKVNKAKSSGGFEDPHKDKFWKLESDAAGNGYAVIRFLPGKTEDDDVFVKTYSHGFQNAAGKWFIDNCPTTIGQECPVCAANNVLWNTGSKDNQEIVRKRKRKVSYISNILVVSDSKHPENEGKVFLFKYGQKIFDKVVGALQPEFEDESPLNPFDPNEGANFKFKMRRVDGRANYDKSEFDSVSSIGNKKEVAAILDQLHDITIFVSPSEFKPYDDLQAKLDKVLGTATQAVPTKGTQRDDGSVDGDMPETKQDRQQRKGGEEKVDNDDDIDFFRSLAEED